MQDRFLGTALTFAWPCGISEPCSALGALTHSSERKKESGSQRKWKGRHWCRCEGRAGQSLQGTGWELQNPRHCWHGVQPTVQGERRRGAGDALIWNVPSCIWVSSITVIAFMGTLQYYISRWNTKWVYLGPGYWIPFIFITKHTLQGRVLVEKELALEVAMKWEAGIAGSGGWTRWSQGSFQPLQFSASLNYRAGIRQKQGAEKKWSLLIWKVVAVWGDEDESKAAVPT